MRILIVHNDYGVYSGEEAVVDRMIADGRRGGYSIEVLRRTSKFSRDNLIGKCRAFVSGIISFSGRRMMREALRTFEPDIVHIHNLYPFISPSVLFLCRKKGVPVVMSVHNYRLICPTGLFLRGGKSCEECLKRGNEWGCVRYNCEGSMFRSVAYALRNYVARKSRAYIDCVDYYCCLTEFQREKLIEAGYDEKKIRVIPNYVEPYKSERERERDDVERFVGYVGRFNYSKGYDMVIEVARRHPEIAFRMAGNVERGSSITIPENVKVCGLLNQEELSEFYEDSAFIVIASRCYEGFPLVLLEAYSHKKSCVVPRHGAFPDLIENEGERCGVMYEPGDVDSMERAIVEMWQEKEKCEELSERAYRSYARRFQKREINKSWGEFLEGVAKQKKESKA